MVLGKDGKPFDRAKYVDWAMKGRSSLALRPLNEQPRRKQLGNKNAKKLKSLDELLGRKKRV
jgi:hypothetical protein